MSGRRPWPLVAASVLLPAGLSAGVGFAVTAQAATSDVPAVRELAPSLVSWQESLTPTGPFEQPLVVAPAPGSGLAVYPSATAIAPSHYLAARNELGSPLVLLAIDREGDRFQVLTPTRPNDDTGWVLVSDVTTSVPVYRVELSLAAHELRVLRNEDDAVMLTSPIGIGKPGTPTPTGEFFVRDHFPTGSDDHPYGPFAFGLSGHSEVLMRFGTGDGRIAIHGTNQPQSIGADMSTGCPRVPNDVVLALIEYLPLGTPVTIS
jgi:lipoprotein-anchoring transpeptidase ErfK/SrfK